MKLFKEYSFREVASAAFRPRSTQLQVCPFMQMIMGPRSCANQKPSLLLYPGRTSSKLSGPPPKKGSSLLQYHASSQLYGFILNKESVPTNSCVRILSTAVHCTRKEPAFPEAKSILVTSTGQGPRYTYEGLSFQQTAKILSIFKELEEETFLTDLDSAHLNLCKMNQHPANLPVIGQLIWLEYYLGKIVNVGNCVVPEQQMAPKLQDTMLQT